MEPIMPLSNNLQTQKIHAVSEHVPTKLLIIMNKYKLSAERFRDAAVKEDKMLRFLERSIALVPESRRVEPAPQILERIEAGVSPEPEGSTIYEMFSRLLARACDRSRDWEAHPAFPGIISQLSPDEALLLARLQERDIRHTATQNFEEMKGLFDAIEPESIDFDVRLLIYPANDRTYLTHLITLGLAEDAMDDTQQPLYGDPDQPKKQTGLRLRQTYRLTAFGRLFAQACAAEAF